MAKRKPLTIDAVGQLCLTGWTKTRKSVEIDMWLNEGNEIVYGVSVDGGEPYVMGQPVPEDLLRMLASMEIFIKGLGYQTDADWEPQNLGDWPPCKKVTC